MSVQTPIGGSATDALEMRRQSLRRQIGVVAALIVIVAAALAAVHFLSPPSPVQDKGSDVAARDPATGGGTAPAGPAVALPAPVAPPQPAESAVPPTALPAIPTPAPTAAGGTPLRSSIRFDGNGADRRHFVQLGSLLPPADAETLRARLQEQGLPTLLETRVRVGPFVTRDEALAAEARLRELGFAADAPAAPGR